MLWADSAGCGHDVGSVQSMMQVDSSTILPNLIVGVILVVTGILITRYRRRMNEWVYEEQKKILGQRMADISAGRQTPFMMGVVGVFISLVGVWALVGATIGSVSWSPPDRGGS